MKHDLNFCKCSTCNDERKIRAAAHRVPAAPDLTASIRASRARASETREQRDTRLRAEMMAALSPVAGAQ